MATAPRYALLALLLLLPAGSARADDCLSFLRSLVPNPDYHPSIYVVMTTINVNNTVSYANTRLEYLPPQPLGRDTQLPARFTWLPKESQGVDSPKFDFGANVQVFSDRLNLDLPPVGGHVGLWGHGRQKFDERQADSLALEITFTQPVRATIKLRSWGDAKAEFTPTCESGGFMYGSTPDVKYMLRVSPWGRS